MVLKEQRSGEDRRKDKKRRKFDDPNYDLPERRKISCRRSGKERRVKSAK
jgi:hypothetical protein